MLVVVVVDLVAGVEVIGVDAGVPVVEVARMRRRNGEHDI